MKKNIESITRRLNNKRNHSTSSQKSTEISMKKNIESITHRLDNKRNDSTSSQESMEISMKKSIESITYHLNKKCNGSVPCSTDASAKMSQLRSVQRKHVPELIRRVVPGAERKNKIVTNVCSLCKDPPYGLMKTCSICSRIFHSLVSFSSCQRKTAPLYTCLFTGTFELICTHIQTVR